MNVKKEFPLLKSKVVYLDSAATAQKPKVVIDSVKSFYETSNANVHRGMYDLGEKATDLYESSRTNVANFIGAGTTEIVFVKNATEAINLVANSWGFVNVKKGDKILLTELEHHSNIVPWQLLAKCVGAKLLYVPITKDGELDKKEFSKLIKQKPKLFAVTHVSNVLGTINPVKKFIAEAHKNKVLVLVDASQSVPRTKIDVKNINCDFLVFTGHKAFGPMGVGVLYAKKDLLENMPPFLGGGSMIKQVHLQESTFADVPARFEAGTPNVAGAVGLAKAIDWLQEKGMGNIQQHEKELTKYARKKLKEEKAIKLYGSENNAGVISFNLGDMHAHDVAAVLNEENICVRAGHHCAMPLMNKLGVPATVRVSFGPYNSKDDVDKLMSAIQRAKKVFRL
ncbi:cysteine desulfurase [Candidatus Woesearchaeota archaeon CG10_big_fil_rev_8_21_14_0_10_37_12]|nr:MAG: cysteine desulfurase [Candidatus Woesearchaeota archaeon CG10_big_fil_rev_8_21_14_0_10_37_12]